MRSKTYLNVNLCQLKTNVKLLKELAPNNEILFMVKANGYGHGILEIVDYSYRHLGIKEIGVATRGEAELLRKELPDLKFEVYVFSDLDLESNGLEFYLSERVLPVIASEKELHFILQNKSAKNLPLCLHFNTGMNRLGLDPSSLNLYIKQIKESGRDEIFHLMSHFSCSSLSINKDKRTKGQYEKFLEIKKTILNNGLKIKNSSIANSGAIEQKYALTESHIRPGLMLYGPSSIIAQHANVSEWKGREICSLHTEVINVIEIKKGTPIGYGATPCPHDGVLVHLALGYGDGILTYYQKLTLRHKNLVGSIVGRINMDLTAVLFPLEAKNQIFEGDEFEFWGENSVSAQQLADNAGTIPYQLFTALTSRIPRRYQLEY